MSSSTSVSRCATDLGEASASELLDLGVALREPEELDALFHDWVAARGADRAAQDLIEYAAGGTPEHRDIGFSLLDRLGEAAEKAVRAGIEDPDLRPHSMAWLGARGLDGPELTLDDMQRLLIDVVAVHLEDDEESLRDAVAEIAAQSGPEYAEIIVGLWQCDHPRTAEVLELLARHHPDPASAKAARKAALRARSQSAPATEPRTTQPGPAAGRRTAQSGVTASTGTASTYQLKITLKGTKPPVWRRVQVPGSITLSGLHAVIQTAMGWTDTHLHEFEIDGVQYATPDDDVGDHLVNEERVRLDEVALEGHRLAYTYDFGDDWRHDLLVEKVLPAEPLTALPVCLIGRRACPPEDVGGPWGYAEFLSAYQDPAHAEHQDYRERAGEWFDPASFDADEVTAELRRLP